MDQQPLIKQSINQPSSGELFFRESPPTSDSTSLHDKSSISTKQKNPNENKSFIRAKSFNDEIWIMLKIFFPICVAALAEYAPQVVINNVIGHLPNASEAIATVGLARMFSALTGGVICQGMISCLYTYIPQAIGANKEDHLHLHVQRAFIITFVLMIPVVVLQFFAGFILGAVGQPKNLMSQTTYYCLLIIPNIYGKTWLFIVQRVAQSLNYNYCVLWSTLIIAALMYPLNILFVYTFDFGYMGSAFALDFASIASFIMIAIYLVYKGYGYIFVPLCCNKEDLKQLLDKKSIYDYCALSFPGMVQSTFEWFIMQIGTILSGFIYNPQIAISCTVIMGLMNGVCIMLCWGCYTAINLRVGKYIGAGLKYEAQRSAKAGLLISITISMVTNIFLICYRNKIPYFFTNDVEIVYVVSYLIIALCFLQTFMIIYNNISSIYRGLGLQKTSAKIVLLGYYFVSLPITLIALFVEPFHLARNTLYGTMGIWSSLALGNLVAAFTLFLWMVFKINWNKCIETAMMRLKRTSQLMKAETNNQTGKPNYGSIEKI